MNKTFSDMKTNVGNNIQDTSTAMATIIGVYLNNRYRDLLKRTNFQIIDEDYSFNTVANTQDYIMPTNFKKELYVFDSTNDVEIAATTLSELATYDPEELDSTGDVKQYALYETVNASGGREKYMRLFYIPDSVETIKVPYLLEHSLSASTDTTVLNCEDVIELGATADAWRYKRQFAKAADFEQLYERTLNNLIWDRENKSNSVVLMRPETFSRNEGIL